MDSGVQNANQQAFWRLVLWWALPVCPWIGVVPCARVPVDRGCARVPVDRGCARVPGPATSPEVQK